MNLPIQEHHISPSVSVVFISLISILYFTEYRSFASLGWYMPRYFILFDVIDGNEILCFLILIFVSV